MNGLGKLLSNIFEFNQATLSGALDVIVIRHTTGELKCTPFHVRIGKFKVFKSREKTIILHVNECLCDIRMKLGAAGEAFFVEETEEDLDSEVLTSPIDSPRMTPCAEEEFSQEEDEKDPKKHRWYWPWGKIPRKVEEPHLSKADEPQILLSVGGVEHFEEGLVQYEHFCADPWEVLHSPDFTIRLENEFYDFYTGLPMILSMLAFDRTAPKHKAEVTESTKYKKTLYLSSESLQKLCLVPGVNTVRYTVYSRLQGEQSVLGKIFLWEETSKIVVSDIDGTITRSDILGQVMPIIGKDWSHAGVVELYNRIHANGYKVLYLSSRPIGQAGSTKGYLTNLTQGDKMLPEGPLIMSPDRLFTSFVREVITRKPQHLKAGILQAVAALFPAARRPFYAAFGNRDTDFTAYNAGGVPLYKIFTINAASSIHLLNSTYVKSYPELDQLSSEMFPPVHEGAWADSGFNDLNFWKDPPPRFHLDEELL